MTLVVTVHGTDTLWVVVDRRLSYRSARPPTDSAVKLVDLDTVDGVGLLAYAGLGSTAGIGTEPSAWMGRTLRGIAVASFEQALQQLAAAAARELPAHLMTLPLGQQEHAVVASAFIDRKVRSYWIGNYADPSGKVQGFFERLVRTDVGGTVPPKFVLAGSGGHYLHAVRSSWQPHILMLVRAFDRGRITEMAVADALAEVNMRAHTARPNTVGPNCIVAWRHRGRQVGESSGGGAQQFYEGAKRVPGNQDIPTISRGIDIIALAEATTGWAMQEMDDVLNGRDISPQERDDRIRKLDDSLRCLPDTQDDRLR